MLFSTGLLVAELADGRLWLAGTLVDAKFDLGGGVLSSVGWGDLFLAQLDANGAHLWSRRHGDVGHQELRGMAVTPDGGLLLTGGVEGTLDIDVVSVTSVGTRDAFLIKLDSEGAGSWGDASGMWRSSTAAWCRPTPRGSRWWGNSSRRSTSAAVR